MPTVFKTADIEHLADRLYSRGVSKMFDDSPSLQADMRLASRVLRALVSRIDTVASEVNAVASLLANLRIEVED